MTDPMPQLASAASAVGGLFSSFGDWLQGKDSQESRDVRLSATVVPSSLRWMFLTQESGGLKLK